MNSAHSSRLNPFHASNYRVSKMNQSTIGYQKRSTFDKLGESIMSQKNYSISMIGIPNSKILEKPSPRVDTRNSPQVTYQLKKEQFNATERKNSNYSIAGTLRMFIKTMLSVYKYCCLDKFLYSESVLSASKLFNKILVNYVI
jgi:hypothetical protein